MKAIWKFQLSTFGYTMIAMPDGAKILSVQFQGHVLCLWAFIDTENVCRPRTFRVFDTGESIPGDVDVTSWVATVQNPGGTLVYHVFEG